MKTKAITCLAILALLVAVLLPGCKRVSSSLNGSGLIVDQDVEIKEFTSINARGLYNLVIQPGEKHKVTISLDDNLFNRIQINLERKTLKLGLVAPATFFPTTFRVTITMPNLAGLNLSGGAKAFLKGFNAPDEFTLFVSDKGLVEGSLVADNLICVLSGGSKVILAGSGQRLELTSSDS
ncbi:MAG TPA: DUF2807 domain-containing protein, partial [Dehalococcoidales bacterium]|nr:DUF2807 domain-containing protein [Dehalococcoidales bacterium]